MITENPTLTINRKNLEPFFEHVTPGGLFLEFGVAGGTSLRQIAELTESIVWGFDSFEGLPEEWGTLPVGAFACDVPNDLPLNAFLVVGLFQETLPRFLEEHNERVSFVHIDCDLYSSTCFVLQQLSDRLNGAVIVFDEIFSGDEFNEWEGRAFVEFLSCHNHAAQLLLHHHSDGAGFKLRKISTR